MESPFPSELPCLNIQSKPAKARRKANLHSIKHQTLPPNRYPSFKAIMAGKGSKSAIPVFLFLGITLVLLPIAAYIFVFIQRRRKRQRSEQSRAETAEQVVKNLNRWSRFAPIEMDNLPAPPVAVQPIRNMSSGKRPVYMHGGLSQQDTPFDKPRGPTTEFTAPSSSVVNVCATPWNPYSTPAPSSPYSQAPPSPRYNLQAALGSEPSPASIHSGSERRANLADAPRVKSLKVRPEESHEAYHNAERPDVPEFEAAYFAERREPARWV